MSSKSIVAEILKRHPELRELSARHLRIVRQILEEAVELFPRPLLTAAESGAELVQQVLDSGKPSAALRAYRHQQELTQRDLAEKSGIPQPHIAAMESGKRPIGLIAAKKLALALGVDYRRLV